MPPLPRFFSRAAFAFALSVGIPSLPAATPEVPDWALPGSATHQQVPPPADFRRPSTTSTEPIGIFEGRTDVGSALVPGKARFDKSAKSYTIDSAGYNIWYHRDEFHYLWKKMSGDVSLAADIEYPVRDGYFDRKAVLVIRQDLDDDSKEIMVALHGAGLIHLAKRPSKGADLTETVRTAEPKKGESTSPLAKRLGIQKDGDHYSLWVSMTGEPMHQVGKETELDLKEPFYVGIGFCSHQPVTSDTAVLTNVVLENESGKVK